MPSSSPSGAHAAVPSGAQSTVSPAVPATSAEEPTLGALVAAASRDMSDLLRNEIALAKAEVKVDAQHAAKGGAMFGAAGFLAVLAIILLSIAAAYGLVAAGLHPAVAFVIVAVVYLIVAAILGLIGKKAISKVGPPERTLRTTKDSVATIKGKRPA